MSEYSFPAINPSELRESMTLWTTIDVRRAASRRASGVALAGTHWIDPLLLTADMLSTMSPRRLAFFCVHGHEVSHYAAALARVHGYDAVVVRGGYDALIAAGAQECPIDG